MTVRQAVSPIQICRKRESTMSQTSPWTRSRSNRRSEIVSFGWIGWPDDPYDTNPLFCRRT